MVGRTIFWVVTEIGRSEEARKLLRSTPQFTPLRSQPYAARAAMQFAHASDALQTDWQPESGQITAGTYRLTRVAGRSIQQHDTTGLRVRGCTSSAAGSADRGAARQATLRV
jgi:hypothetical protein